MKERTKTYLIEVIEIDGGIMKMSRTNDGFSPFELIGLAEHIKEDVFRQLRGEIKPDIIERRVIRDKRK